MSRLGALLAVVVALAVPLQSSQSVAFATHTNTTPTPTPWPSGGGQPTYNSGVATPTPTLAGYGSYQPAQGQTQYPGSASQPYPDAQNQAYPSTTGQQSVSAPAPGGMAAGAIVSGATSPVAGGTDLCYGDELITFSPETPRIGNEFLIAVTSAHPHPYGRLAGTEPTQFVRERPGQRGYVWEWTVQPSYPGTHEYTFYVDSTVPCQKVQIQVLQSLATSTPKPSKTPTPYGWDNGNGNSNTNDNSNGDSNAVYVYPTYGSTYAYPVDPSFYVVPGQDLHNCSAFDSQSNAQRVLRYDPSDPNKLDVEPDGVTDGVACLTWVYSQYPSDRDVVPVAPVTQTPMPTATTATTPTRTPTQTPTLTPTSAAFNPVSYLNQGDRYGCRDFASHANAQAVLRADPTDPNRLDPNRDGLACGGVEAAADGVPGGFMPEPFDGVRVLR